MPPRKILKKDTKILDLVTFQPLKAPLNVGQKYVYSLHIIAIYPVYNYIAIYIYITIAKKGRSSALLLSQIKVNVAN